MSNIYDILLRRDAQNLDLYNYSAQLSSSQYAWKTIHMVQPGLRSNSAHASFLSLSLSFSHEEGEIAAQMMLSSAFFSKPDRKSSWQQGNKVLLPRGQQAVTEKDIAAAITRKAFLSTWGNDNQEKCPDSELRPWASYLEVRFLCEDYAGRFI